MDNQCSPLAICAANKDGTCCWDDVLDKWDLIRIAFPLWRCQQLNAPPPILRSVAVVGVCPDGQPCSKDVEDLIFDIDTGLIFSSLECGSCFGLTNPNFTSVPIDRLSVLTDCSDTHLWEINSWFGESLSHILCHFLPVRTVCIGGNNLRNIACAYDDEDQEVIHP